MHGSAIGTQLVSAGLWTSLNVSNLCNHYIQSLVWTTHYYFQSCISQSWYYPFEFAPTLQDLSHYLEISNRTYVKPNDKIYSPVEQLEYVFPYQSYHLCEELKDKKGIPITELPKQYTLLKRYDWECEPIFDSH